MSTYFNIDNHKPTLTEFLTCFGSAMRHAWTRYNITLQYQRAKLHIAPFAYVNAPRSNRDKREAVFDRIWTYIVHDLHSHYKEYFDHAIILNDNRLYLPTAFVYKLPIQVAVLDDGDAEEILRQLEEVFGKRDATEDRMQIEWVLEDWVGGGAQEALTHVNGRK